MRSLRFRCIAIAFLLIPLLLHAQKQNNVWYFGAHAGIDFNSPAPVALTDGMLDTYEGSASIADPNTGALLFYTDGITVWNRRHQVMPNGTGLFGNASSTQSALIVPLPGSSSIYYVFTSAAIEERNQDGVRYSIVDMNGNGGFGNVTTKNVLLLTPATERLTATAACSENAWWILAHGLDNNEFRAFKLTPAGIVSPPVISRAGMVAADARGAIGYMRISPNGRRLAIAQSDFSNAELFDFNVTTGVVANPILLTTLSGSYGVAFSPDNTKLYISEWVGSVYQYDISLLNPADIIASKFKIYTPQSFIYVAAMQLAPDGKIYCALQNSSLGVINNPNASGIAADFVLNGFSLLPASSRSGLPNMFTVDFKGKPLAAGPDQTICFGDSVVLTASGGDSNYLWSPAAGLSCTNCGRIKASPAQTTTYVVKSPNGCSTEDSVTIFVRPTPIASLGKNRVICKGNSISLSTVQQPGNIYHWSPATGLSCTDCPSPLATPDSTIDYTLTVTGQNGCSATAILRVTVLGPVPHDPHNDTTICVGGFAILNATDGNSWKWIPTTGLSCSDCQRTIARPTTTTTYTVIVAGIGGCTRTDSMTVTIAPAMIADAGSDTTICAGGNTTLHASDGKSWQWIPADGLRCANCREPIAAPSATTTYHVIITGTSGCSASDSVTVSVIPAIGSTHRMDTICPGGTISLRARDGKRWSWTPITDLSCADCREPIAAPSITTTYLAQITGSGGCPALDSFTVVVASVPIADAGNDTAICAGTSAMLHASNGKSWQWIPAGGLRCADCREPIASPAITTTYHVTITNSAGCAGVDSVTVTVIPQPFADAGNDTTICAGERIALHATGGSQYHWSPAAGLSCTDCADPIASPEIATRYLLTAYNALGCPAFDSVMISISSPRLVDAGSDTSICIGESVQLHATGGDLYRWSPADGLSCDDCDDPIASPSRTITYQLTAIETNGCAASFDSVMIIVREPNIIHAHIPRDLHALPGTAIRVPILIDDPDAIATIDSYNLHLRFRPGMIRIRDILTDETASAGWIIADRRDTIGAMALTMHRLSQTTTRGDTLLLITMQAYVGDSVASELPFTIDPDHSSCTSLMVSPGLFHLDSICGLSHRLIEAIAGKYALKQTAPNPFSPPTTIEFSIALDGPTTLVITNERGEIIATLLNEYLQPGSYAVTWDAANVPSGLYYCQLRSGDWSATNAMMLVR
ncbi:MAG: hypothetical protein ABIQ57_09000 [Candidatus Kapaibacterium sp.]